MTLSDLTTPGGETTTSDHIRGNPDAAVTLLEYGEFECPDCGRAYHSVRKLLEETDEVAFAFRHFVRNDVHAFSERSALAAEAAGAQGLFWEMHDFLFERQHQLEYEDLVRHARELGLDVDRFESDMRTRSHLSTVQDHLASGVAADVTETPTFFINGARYEGPHDAASLLTAVRKAQALP
jgi:protein-disulfide isomerase